MEKLLIEVYFLIDLISKLFQFVIRKIIRKQFRKFILVIRLLTSDCFSWWRSLVLNAEIRYVCSANVSVRLGLDLEVPHCVGMPAFSRKLTGVRTLGLMS